MNKAMFANARLPGFTFRTIDVSGTRRNFRAWCGFCDRRQSSMNARTTTRTTTTPLQYNRLGRDHPWLGAIIEPIDAWLRAREGVYEYSASSECVLRIQIVNSRESLVLSDGTPVRHGDRIINLHLWNEQLPIVPKDGATLAWARHMSRAVDLSLRELALYLAARHDLNPVVALRANISFGSVEQSEQIARIAARYGFERAGPAHRRTLADHLHWFGENVLISLMVIARNTSAFRVESLRRHRTPVYMSRRKLASRLESRSWGRLRCPSGSQSVPVNWHGAGSSKTLLPTGPSLRVQP
jgi:hypothetical protein